MDSTFCTITRIEFELTLIENLSQLRWFGASARRQEMEAGVEQQAACLAFESAAPQRERTSLARQRGLRFAEEQELEVQVCCVVCLCECVREFLRRTPPYRRGQPFFQPADPSQENPPG